MDECVDFSFLADFISAEITESFFASDATTGTEGVAETAQEAASCSSGEKCSDEIQRLIGKNTNVNTAKSTQNWISKYGKWAADNQVQTDLAEIPEDKLDDILQRFYAGLRKKNGENYEPESLKVMQAALDRYLRDKGCSFSIIKDRKFDILRKVLNGKAIELQQSGLGKRKRKADALTHDEEEMIWSSGVLDGNNPTSLNYLTFYVLSQHMGTRGRQEHHQIRVEDLKIVRNIDGDVRYIEWVEGPTKTRQGGLKKRPRSVTQKLFKIGGPKCPVAAIIKLLLKRPEALISSGPLYLAPLRKEREWSEAKEWYARSPIGVNQIDRFMDLIASKAGLDVTKKRFTNHSLRKTTVTKLRKSGATTREIMAITGHKSEQSLADYDNLDFDDHRHLGEVLGGVVESPSQLPSECTITPQASCIPKCKPLPPTPFTFQNCTFNNCFSSCSSSYTQQTRNSTKAQSSHSRKRAYVLSSDSESN